MLPGEKRHDPFRMPAVPKLLQVEEKRAWEEAMPKVVRRQRCRSRMGPQLRRWPAAVQIRGPPSVLCAGVHAVDPRHGHRWRCARGNRREHHSLGERPDVEVRSRASTVAAPALPPSPSPTAGRHCSLAQQCFVGCHCGLPSSVRRPRATRRLPGTATGSARATACRGQQWHATGSPSARLRRPRLNRPRRSRCR